ncbi:biotin--[acetyl-CoA-carboxylase] ligase [Naumannella halotolerans]|uniref:biotin--[biotin carboxyl-carrier protein] ligase n=1 Tax=Naumannella halotolerans TaxID=993414 RepID=A0A4R7J9C8_9ACTN|nr:biotin--[acetyl-CoA-carboxylase] ligase [Naumannella halotolerans]TDT34120.1 BirA family biotin operon repressor/biotin-[acetyl-CoA-carboxylase] ligase [Naumannella halotolerans]
MQENAAGEQSATEDPESRRVDEAGLRTILRDRWREVRVVDVTGSTNADLAAAVARGEAGAGTVLLAGHQVAGRGRLGRSWGAPAWTSVATSVVLRPARSVLTWSWFPLLVGLSVATGITRSTGLPPLLKWPNDVLIDDRKVCGILGQHLPGTPPSVVLGFGLNTWLDQTELPVPTAGSLSLACADHGLPAPDATRVLGEILLDLADRLVDFETGPEAEAIERSRQAWLRLSDTVGRDVRVELGDSRFHGRAESIDTDGRLLVRAGETVRAFSAGDVVHLRRQD